MEEIRLMLPYFQGIRFAATSWFEPVVEMKPSLSPLSSALIS
jgi:hypothetical protein